MNKSKLFLLICFILMVALIAAILILYIITPLVGISLIPSEYVFDFVNIIPGPIYTDILILLLLPLLVGGFYILIAPWLVAGLYRINKLTYFLRKAPNYGIFDKGSEIKFSTYFYRSLIVGLFTFGTSTILINLFGYKIFRVSFVKGQ